MRILNEIIKLNDYSTTVVLLNNYLVTYNSVKNQFNNKINGPSSKMLTTSLISKPPSITGK